MRKSLLRSNQDAVIDECAAKCEQLLRWAMRGSDTKQAMLRIEGNYAIPSRTQWALRYRRPKDLSYGLVETIRRGYERARIAQIERLKLAADATAKWAGDSHPAVVEARALVVEAKADATMASGFPRIGRKAVVVKCPLPKDR